jgi:hypothetical protein
MRQHRPGLRSEDGRRTRYDGHGKLLRARSRHFQAGGAGFVPGAGETGRFPTRDSPPVIDQIYTYFAVFRQPTKSCK